MRKGKVSIRKGVAHPDRIPCLVYADRQGNICDHPGLLMAGRSGRESVLPNLEDLIPLPAGSELFVLPERLPIGFDPKSREQVAVTRDPADRQGAVQAVAAFMAPAHTAVHWAAFHRMQAEIPPLPLFAYTAVGWYKGQFWVSAFRSDQDRRQESGRFPDHEIKRRTLAALKSVPGNRLIQHLGRCSLTYRCPAAINYFMNRWEAPLPTSPACNARCIGCISLQPSGCCPSTQERITFVPTADEIVEVAVPHLESVQSAVVSFGQGCEGEPLLEADTIEKAIRRMRQLTDKGTVNLNSNASLPSVVERLADAGLDSLRVSMNSARLDYHRRYYRPKGFDFSAVQKSIRVMKEKGRFVSLNYFILPGFTDDPDEFAAFCNLVETCSPDFIQLRNLNMDPDWYLDSVEFTPSGEALGVTGWLKETRRRFPHLRFGYFNPPLR